MIMVFLKYFCPYVLLICLVVTVHEFGHYLVARLCGVKVRTFSIGFGPELFGFTSSSGTRWRVSLIPLGGYVGFIGGIESKDAFSRVKAWKRMLISLAGPLANWIAAVLTFVFILYTTCFYVIDPVVSSVISGGPADVAGIKARDRILSIDELNISNVGDINSYVNSNISKMMKVVFKRDNVGNMSVNIVPRAKYTVNNFGVISQVASIGLSFDKSNPRLQYRSIAESFLKGLNYSFYIVGNTIISIYDIFFGNIKPDKIAGPIILAKIAKDVASEGFNSYIWFVAILSLSIGLFNLLPIPLLDGGNFLVFLLETIRGKSIGKSAETVTIMIGFFIIVTLSIFVVYNDIYRLIS